MKTLLKVILCLSVVVSASVQAKIIHKERSLYRNIAVMQEKGERCLIFTIKRKHKARQSCMDLDDPEKIVFRYAQVALSSLAIQPEPENILVLGLGGGTLPMAYEALLPNADITTLEIDPSVTKVAKEYFGLKESDRQKVVEQDARVFVKRALKKDKRYDLIVLDAFNGDYIPEHLMTQEFLQEVKDLLADKGVVVSNTFSSSRLYDHESATYQKVFGEFYNFKIPYGNRIVVAADFKLPAYDKLIEQAQAVEEKLPLEKMQVSLLYNMALIEPDIDWKEDARLLTDQYSPANLLQGKDWH